MTKPGGGDIDGPLAVAALGNLDIRWHGESAHHRIPRKAALLLAYLADCDAVVRRSTVAGLLYSDLPDDRARSNLRVVLTRLRSALPGAVGADRSHIWLEATTSYDVAELSADDRVGAVLEHYRGDFLADADADAALLFDDWVSGRRQELRTGAIRTLTLGSRDAAVSGEWARCLRCAERVVELEPWNETAHRQVMMALAATSGTSAALAQFAACEATLETELGLPPSPETLALRDDIARRADEQVAAPDYPVTVRSRVTLPYDLTPFFGRAEELPAMSARLVSGGYRLLSLVGPGGVGKTRLAAEIAAQNVDAFPDGVHFVPLADTRSLSDVMAAVAESVAPAAVTSLADPVANVADLIGDRRMCLVLDNLEQVVEAVAAPIGDLLGRCPNLRLVATSREPLDTRAEDVFVIQGLDVPPRHDSDIGRWSAVRLFVDRAYRANKSFSLADEDPAEIGALCRLLEGMPLQLELVAARTTSESVSSLLRRLERADDLPGEGPKDTPDRHRSFDAVFEQSWALLSDEDRTALMCLSVTRGGFNSAAAGALLGTSGHEANRLARKSLLVQEGNGRYRFHELLRQAADTRLGPALRTETEERHARWFLGQLAAGTQALISGNDPDGTAMLIDDLDNIRTAWWIGVERGMTELLGAAANGLGYLLELAGHRIDAPSLLLAAADAVGDGTMDADGEYGEAFFVRVAAGLIAATTNEDSFEAMCDRIDVAAGSSPHAEIERAWSALHRAQSAFYRGELARAAALLDERDDNKGTGGSLEAWTMLQRGRLLSAAGAFDTAVATYRDALERFEELGDVRAQARANSYLAPAYAEQNLVWEAYEADRAAMEMSEWTGNRQRQGDLHTNVGASLVLLGAYERAREHTAAGLAVIRETGDLAVEGYVLAQHGECLIGLGEFDKGEADIVEGLRLSRAQGFSYGLLYNLPPWIRHLEASGRSEQALLAADELVAIAADREADHFVATAQALRARSMASLRRFEEAIPLARRIADDISGSRASRLPWPVATLLDLATVLRSDDVLAAALIAEASDIQQRTARSIEDPELRRSYLEDHPSSLELRSLR